MAEKFLNCSETVWCGSVCLEVTLSESDISSNDNPEPVFVHAPRFSFLPVTLADVVVHFRQHAIEFSSDVWFEANGVPLRSTFPTGFLFDQHGKGSCPWKIVVHFQAFPSSLLLRCSGPIESEHFYFHSLKQALFLLHGTTRLFNELSVEQQRRLWKSVQYGDRSGFESVAWALRPAALLEGLQQVDATLAVRSAVFEVKSVPVRLARPESPVLQRPVAVWRDANSEGERAMRTVMEALQEDFRVPLPAAEDAAQARCIVQGVEVPLDAPIYDFWRLMSHCDLFLYVTLRAAE